MCVYMTGSLPVKTIAFTSFLLVASSNFSFNPTITTTTKRIENQEEKKKKDEMIEEDRQRKGENHTVNS